VLEAKSAPPGAPPLIAIAGNPNTGKTTLFNRLTGLDRKVGNYPGVTVDRAIGKTTLPGRGAVRVMDVPGTYSLSARSEEEQIAIQAIAGLPPNEPPDVVVMVVDATQLTRNLYLVLQVIETDVPVVVALNMVDMLEATGQAIDREALERAVRVPVVCVSGKKGTGIDELRAAIDRVLSEPALGRPGPRWIPETDMLAEDIDVVREAAPAEWRTGSERRRDALAVWALLSLTETDELRGIPGSVRAAVAARRAKAATAGRWIDAEVIEGRYGWIDRHAGDFLQVKELDTPGFTQKLDSVVLNPALGFVIFLTVMGVVFQSLFSWADPAISAVELAFAWLARISTEVLPAGIARDFVVEGLIAGVGSVLVFLPQILLLFLFIGLMEDTGYMARVAFLMDRIMRMLGLNGRAFVPMMSGFACAVPAILATRTMERRRDRFLTMMVIPLMTCSARLPIYSLLIAALIPPLDLFGFMPVQGLLMAAMYLFSTIVALLAAAVLSRTLFRAPHVPLILELPPYRFPHLPSVLRMMWLKSRVFLTEAGGVILVCTIALWLLLSFPKTPDLDVDYAGLRAEAQAAGLAESPLQARLSAIDSEESGARLRASYGGRLGRVIEPVIAPLGFDWKIGVGLIGAFAAREVFVSTMGIVYGVGDEVDEESVTLRERIKNESYADGRRVYTPLVGLSLMVFFALACQCMSTLAAVKRETNSWRWPSFLFVYMTVLAWGASFAVYQGGRLLGFE